MKKAKITEKVLEIFTLQSYASKLEWQLITLLMAVECYADQVTHGSQKQVFWNYLLPSQ